LEKFIVMGGSRLVGEIKISGAKNAILPIMAASLLTKGQSTILQVPRINDVLTMQKILTFLGSKVSLNGSEMFIDGADVDPKEVTENLMRQLRASNLIIGPLLSRFRKLKVAYPGGCAIGSRPMDLHLKGFRSLGAKVTERYGFIELEAQNLQGADIHLDYPSVGATENLMMAATLAQGHTIIRNAAKEPEIVDLQNYLNALGARIKGAGLDTLRIEGVKELGSAKHNIIPDRIEAGTHMVAAAMTGGNVVIRNVIADHLEPVIAKLKETGARIKEYEDGSLRVIGPSRLKAVDCKTLPYPGFPTDMQPQIMSLAAVAEGTSVIAESIFDNRFKHVDELRRMGAKIKVEGRAAIVKGVPRLSGAFVEATDLRAGAALVLAGLVAEDATVIEKIKHIDRGYENLEVKYAPLGARIIRVNNTRNGSW
jgi:UDP-N-acetylglucosamine 1-carboxyvinyltransferase